MFMIPSRKDYVTTAIDDVSNSHSKWIIILYAESKDDWIKDVFCLCARNIKDSSLNYHDKAY